MAKRVSASNVLERAPIKGKGKAAQVGAIGAALAATYLAAAEQAAVEEVKQQKSMKERLKDLIDLPRAEHLAFRAEMKAKQDAIGQQAEKAKLKVVPYLEGAPIDASVYATASLWMKLSSAVETGWKPDLDKSWAEISKAATAALDNAKAMAKQETIRQQIEVVKADPAMPEEQKQAKIVLLNAEIAANPVTTGPTAHTSPAAPKTNLQKAIDLLDGFPLQDMEAVHDWLGKRIIVAKSRPIVAKAPKGSGAPVGEQRAPKETEHATARKDAKRTRK